MEKKDFILTELELVAPGLVVVGQNMPFILPDGYFETFPVEMLAKLTAPAQQPSVPEGYFDSLPSIMLAKVKALEVIDELSTVAPVLAGIGRQMPYSVPAGYFENLLAEPVQEKVPVVSINKKAGGFKWAAAAAVIALAGFFSWQFLANTRTNSSSSSLALNPLDTNNNVIEVGLSQLADTSLGAELKERGMTGELSSALFYLNTENFESALKELSDEEIKSQLPDMTLQNKS